MTDYDPWAESHKPQKFPRTDPSGRWSPISEDGQRPLMVDFIGLVVGVLALIAVYYFWI